MLNESLSIVLIHDVCHYVCHNTNQLGIVVKTMRITKNILLKKLEILCKQLGKRMGFQKGEWYLDYASCYGGYIVVEAEENGGEHHPLLSKRLSAQNMADALDMAIATTTYR